MTRLLGFALAIALLGGAPSHGQFLHTFTPDPPPIGDGIDYPRTINPARQFPGGGVAPDAFDAGMGVIFNNTNGNPAFFDGNNLLTRPSALVTNEAFWTDPKIGTYDGGGFDVEESSVGMQFVPAAGADFGFDLAIASVSEAVPTSLPVFFQNSGGDTATVELDLVTGGLGAIQPIQAGTFDTLNSIFPAREARYRISHAQLEGILGSPEPVIIFALEMGEIETGNGTTQVAIDNFVIAGAEALPNEAQREPVRFQSELLEPGESQGFVFLPGVGDPGDIEIDLGLLSVDLIELAALAELTSAALPEQLEAEATITYPDGTPMVERRINLGWPPPASPPAPPAWVPPAVTPAGGHAVVESPGSEGVPFYVEIQSYLSDRLEMTQAQIEETLSRTRFVEDLTQPGTDFVDLIDRRNATLLMLEEMNNGERSARGVPGGTSLYGDYSLGEYLAEMRADGLEPVVGDTGGDFVPVTDDDGQIVDFLATAWRIADAPSEFVPVLLVPEPAGAGMLTIGSLVLAVAARRRRGR